MATGEAPLVVNGEKVPTDPVNEIQRMMGKRAVTLTEITESTYENARQREALIRYINQIYLDGGTITVQPAFDKHIQIMGSYRGNLPSRENSLSNPPGGCWSSEPGSFMGEDCYPDFNTGNLILVERDEFRQHIQYAILELPEDNKPNFEVISVNMPEKTE